MHYGLTFFGVKDTSEDMIKYIHTKLHPVSLIVTVSSAVEKKNAIAGFKGLNDVAKNLDIPIFEADSYKLDDEKTNDFFGENTFELGLVTGWQRLIPPYVLERFSKGVYGLHGSSGYLPFGRGRSPLNWSLLLGDTRFNLNLFRYDEKADSPNVFATRMFSLNIHDTIRTAQYKNQLCAKDMIKDLVREWEKVSGTPAEIPLKRESHDFDSWYEKRTPADGNIDFKARTREIYNLVRSVSEPFPCAFCSVHTEKGECRVTVKEAHPFDEIMDFSAYMPGEIIEVFDGKPIVRTVDGSLIIDRYDCEAELKAGYVLY